MAIRTELSLRLQNTPGALARVCKVLTDEHVNVLALSVEGRGLLRMVVDNHVHAAGALREHQYAVEERDVLSVQMSNGPWRVGGGGEAARKCGCEPRLRVWVRD